MGAQWKAKGKAAAADARGKLFGRLAKDILARLAERGTAIFMCTHVLEIADDYAAMDPELVELLRTSLPALLGPEPAER